MAVQSSERQSVLKKVTKFWNAKNGLNEVFWLRYLQNIDSYSTPESIILVQPCLRLNMKYL